MGGGGGGHGGGDEATPSLRVPRKARWGGRAARRQGADYSDLIWT